MRPCWLVALVACSGERAEPQRRAEPAVDPGKGRRSIDVTVDAKAVSIRGVELAPTPQPGVLELGYRVDARDPKLAVPARIMCRVGGYNVVYPGSEAGKVPGPRLTAVYRPDPFSEAPQACEVAFFIGDKQIATACYQTGELRDGACPDGTFPRPERVTRFPVEITGAKLELREGTAVVSGLFTLAEPLVAGRKFVALIRCEDPAGTTSGEGVFAFLPLDRIPVGASIYGPVAIFLTRTPQPSATCELEVASRPTTGAPTGQVAHARYCFTGDSVRPGEC